MRAIGAAGMTALGSTLATLVHEGLIADEYEFGAEKDRGWTIRVRPTGLGAELFLWGHGSVTQNAQWLTGRQLDLVFLRDVPQTPNATLMSGPQPPSESSGLSQDTNSAAE